MVSNTGTLDAYSSILAAEEANLIVPSFTKREL
jgi:hypothetical protein